MTFESDDLAPIKQAEAEVIQAMLQQVPEGERAVVKGELEKYFDLVRGVDLSKLRRSPTPRSPQVPLLL